MASHDPGQDDERSAWWFHERGTAAVSGVLHVVRILDSNLTGITANSGYTVEQRPCRRKLAAAARK
jgi:hypothetical protein